MNLLNLVTFHHCVYYTVYMLSRRLNIGLNDI